MVLQLQNVQRYLLEAESKQIGESEWDFEIVLCIVFLNKDLESKWLLGALA